MKNKITSEEYKKHFEVFERNLNFAARTLNYHMELSNKAHTQKKTYLALNKTSMFWIDFQLMATISVIISLGKIFDQNSKTHNISKTVKGAKNNLDYFAKTSLKKRKTELAGEFEGLDTYISNAHELSLKDFKRIRTQEKRARKIWERVEPLRNKIFAHAEVLSPDEITQLHENVKYSDLRKIIDILLKITNALREAEFNGKKPDFRYKNDYEIRRSKKETNNLIKQLTKK